MRERPAIFKLLALGNLFIALGIPIQVLILFPQNPLDFLSLAAKIAPLNWLVIGAALINILPVMRASRAALYTTGLLILVTAWNNYVIAKTGLNYSPWMAGLGVLGVMALHGLFFHEDAISILKRPEMRWWRVPTRKNVRLPTFIRPVTGGHLLTKTFDLSSGGIFFPTRDTTWVNSINDTHAGGLVVGTCCAIRLTLDKFNVLHCSGQVVRASPLSHGKYPGGFAIRFICMDGEKKKMLDDFLETVPESRPMGGIDGRTMP